MKKGKRRSKKRLNYRFCFISVFVVYVLYAFIGQQSSFNSYNKEIVSLNKCIEQKEEELSRLNDMESVYRSDEFIERVARERLGFVRSDETVFVDITGK